MANNRANALSGRFLALSLVMCMILTGFGMMPVTEAATPEQPQPLATTTYTIANESWLDDATWFNPIDGDILILNSGGIVHMMWNWSGSQAGTLVGFNGTTVNLGGIFIQHNGTTCKIHDTFAITINEGGQWRSLGTSGSRCAITGSNTATSGHQIRIAGKFYSDYTDISTFFIGLYNYLGGSIEIRNSTVSNVGVYSYYTYRSGSFIVVNSTLDAPTNRDVFSGDYDIVVKAINSVFTSVTDNRLSSAGSTSHLEFFGCTYQGVAITTDDIGVITQDIDTRIYEKSTVTSNVPDVHWSLSHDLMDSTGMVYDSDNYMKIPGYLAYGTGNTTLYTLNRSAYWPSGTAVAARQWFNVSNNPSGYEWNITASKWNYFTNATEVWSGTNATINLTVIPAAIPPGLEQDAVIVPYNAADIPQADYTWGEHCYPGGSITFTAVTTATLNLTIINASGVTKLYLGEATDTYTAGTSIGIRTTFGATPDIDTSLLVNGTYIIVLKISDANITTTYIYGEFAVLAALIPGLEATAFVGTYNALGDYQANYTWDIEDVDVNGEVTFTYAVTGCNVNITVRDASSFTVLWLGNYTDSYTGGVGIQLTTTTGGAITVNTSLLSNETYAVVVRLEHENITATEIFGGFAVLSAIYPPAAFVNISAFNNVSTAIVNISNQFNYNETAYFNGTIGTSYDTLAVVINITVNDNSGYRSTLWNGTHNFTGNSNVSFTNICGDVLNYTTTVFDDYYVLVEVQRTGLINYTAITEGFMVTNLTINNTFIQIVGGSISYRYVAFFEWELGQSLMVNFEDRSTTEYPVQITNYLWMFGDSTTGSGERVSHKYAMPGKYNVTLVATFSDGNVYAYSTVVSVVDNAISWWMYAMIGMFVFIGILTVGWLAIKKQSRKLAMAMFLILCGFIAISIIALQMFIG